MCASEWKDAPVILYLAFYEVCFRNPSKVLRTWLSKVSEHACLNIVRKIALNRVEKDSSNLNKKVIPKGWTSVQEYIVYSC